MINFLIEAAAKAAQVLALSAEFAFLQFEYGPQTYDTLQLDAMLGPKYATVAGAMIDSDTRIASPVGGPCYPTAGDAFFCLLDSDGFKVRLKLESADGGLIQFTTQDGAILQTSTITRAGLFAQQELKAPELWLDE